MGHISLSLSPQLLLRSIKIIIKDSRLVDNSIGTAAQKIKKLSETTATDPIVAKLCMIDSENRKIAEKLVQPVTPHVGCFQ